jgi:CheY-like chemotaxis protein
MEKNMQIDNDDFIKFEDTDEYKLQIYDTWKVIIADDDSEVHKVTKLVLKNFVFEGKGLNILSAYSEAQTKDLIYQNPDTAVIFLDVIMEKDDSGLNVVKYIRDELKNRSVRIILRTGQPGQALEDQAIESYDINDYKEKTELTSNKLFTTLVTALRTYHHIMDLEHSKKGLEEIISSTAEIFKPHTTDSFYDILLKYVISILSTGSSSTGNISGFIAVNDNNSFYLVSGSGTFSSKIGSEPGDVVNGNDYELILKCIKSNNTLFKARYHLL